MVQPKWVPSADVIAAANLTEAIAEQGLESYDEFYEWSRTDRAGYWGYAARRLGIVMRTPPHAVLGSSGNVEDPTWFAGAKLNVVESCFLAPENSVAIRHQRGSDLHDVSYGELRRLVNRTANGLADLGISRGDRVAIAMPMNLEAVVTYLAIVLSGAVVVSIADSFAPDEIATRLRIGEADTVVTQDVIVRNGKVLPMFDKVVAAGARRAIVVGAGDTIELRPADTKWDAFVSDDDAFSAVMVEPGAHMNILFSSGTTGDPKAIPWTHLSPVKAAVDAHFHQDLHPEDVVAWPTNLGWMMGPWLIYSSFVNRATLALSDQVPTSTGFAEFVEAAEVTVLGVVPSLVAAWRRTGAVDGRDWSRVRLFSSTGEASNPDDMAFLMDLAGNKPIMDYIGGTELAGAYMSGTVLQPCIPGTFTTPTLGGGIHILDESGAPSYEGELFIEPPCIGLSVELLNRDHHEVYYAGTPDIGVPLRRHGDHMLFMDNGHYRAQGRTDDAMNLGGIKVGSAEIERVVKGTPGLVDVAAIAVEPPGGGPSRLVMCVVADSGLDPEELKSEMQKRIRTELNPLFRISDVMLVDALPRTASAKVKRRDLRSDYLSR